ncbi:hypothetical protein [Thermospira aquatica]|uniref:Uncharacterized protein n=1 Tax=Thermospira aquatica TaxID=2828656 RepID=A0AAX3BEF5_9SPIR|nr:hypothetical protein [Thermospira aquatica]URA10601.1 hypothetical protein KDW03_02010 [Thermospira aquatica]
MTISDIENKGKFGEVIENLRARITNDGDRVLLDRLLKDVLKGGNTKENNSNFVAIRDRLATNYYKDGDSKDMLERTKLLNYLNGLKYIYDFRDVAAVGIAKRACCMIANYTLAGANGILDPTEFAFEDYFVEMFNKGLVGYSKLENMSLSYFNSGSYNRRSGAPVYVWAHGWSDNMKINELNGGIQRAKLYGVMDIEDDGVKHHMYWYVRADMIGKSTNLSLEFSGGWSLEKVKARMQELSNRLNTLMGDYENSRQSDILKKIRDTRNALKGYKDILDSSQAIFANLRRLYDASPRFFMVQRKSNEGDTHFMLGMYVGGTLRLYDHNPWGKWDDICDREDYIVNYFWY